MLQKKAPASRIWMFGAKKTMKIKAERKAREPIITLRCPYLAVR
jgi:hypothetical protein